MPKKYHVTLTVEERTELEAMTRRGHAAARKLTHARILLECDEGTGGPAERDEDVAEALEVGDATVARVRQRFVEEGLAAALTPKPRPPRMESRKLDGDGEAHLIALACSRPPQGCNRWTLRLLADRMVVLGHAERGLSYETVRRTLKKTS
jgi:transposase